MMGGGWGGVKLLIDGRQVGGSIAKTSGQRGGKKCGSAAAPSSGQKR